MSEFDRSAVRHPRCGRCGYDLTGAPGNRCAECGALFIEAGVLIARPRRRGRWIRGMLLVAAAVLVPTIIGLMTTLYYRARAAAEAAAARAAMADRAARTAAVAKFQADMLQGVSASMPTSAPARQP